jgi:hypothetical protein
MIVFQVPQAYSLPTTRTPRISSSAPRKTGRPPIALPTRFAGSVDAIPRSAVGPVAPAAPAYGIR